MSKADIYLYRKNNWLISRHSRYAGATLQAPEEFAVTIKDGALDQALDALALQLIKTEGITEINDMEIPTDGLLSQENMQYFFESFCARV